MSSISIELSTEQLLQAVERLSAQELAAFAARVNALHEQRVTRRLDQTETNLLLRINRPSLTPEEQSRFDHLVARRQNETISVDELQELIALTNKAEASDVVRLQAIQSLAQLRSTSVQALMATLGIKAPRYG
ncbi:hypothetical protein [Candidatus Viridilinea mediisalina]|uniref:STAS/SEC14 domain-containing protein n=1 Tax=Candidatus Viridilinea mediisalina TaxID=2024553 RepID=A0A2A6RKS6_9CHLR|nr:hypothetical protein [Candidatus Viridilinea mediisalina]PDW03687.1 hypothetical protein CJ255_07655 [Candidatus Viridilinea mediisalina]